MEQESDGPPLTVDLNSSLTMCDRVFLIGWQVREGMVPIDEFANKRGARLDACHKAHRNFLVGELIGREDCKRPELPLSLLGFIRKTHKLNP